MGYDDECRTPPPQPPVGGRNDVLEHRLTSVELKFSELRQMASQNKDLLIETVGKSGSNGRLGVLNEKLNTIQQEIEDLTKMFEEQRKYISKIVLAMLVTSSLGAGGAQVAMKLLGGGW